MSAFTSKASGDFDAVGQTTWNEAGAPVSGDTAAIQNTHNVRIDAGTGDEASLSIDIQAGGTLTIDDESGGALSLIFDDTASCGFGASAGTLVCVGNAGNGITITSAATPPSNYWDGENTIDITADYTTFSYMTTMQSTGTWDVDNCTFSYSSGRGVRIEAGATITSFTNNTIDNSGHDGFTSQVAHTSYDNIVITNTVGYDIHAWDATCELNNSNFDATDCVCNTTGIIFSDNHNDIASTQVVIMASGDTVTASELTATVLGVGHTLETYKGVTAAVDPTFSLDGNYSVFDIDVKVNTILELDAVSYAAVLTLSFDDTASCGFGASDGSLLCIGNSSFGVTITSAAGAGVTNYWDFYTTMNITADYTLFSYYDRGIASSSLIDIDNCTFDNASQEGWWFFGGVTTTSFDNNTISNTGDHAFIHQQGGVQTIIDNLTITNAGNLDLYLSSGGAQLQQLTNSNFDVTNISVGATDVLISDNHNDVVGAWAFVGGATNTYVKSDFTTDFNSADNITIYAGLLTVDEAAAHNNLTIKNGGIFDVNPNITQTITQGTTITVESGGTLNWTGTAGNLITSVSSTPTMNYFLDAKTGSALQISYLDVQDCDASISDAGELPIDGTDNCTDNGRNVDWDFGVAGKAFTGHDMVGIDMIGNPIIYS